VPWLTPIADQAQLIVVDHRGNGRSSRPPVETRTLANMADDLEALRKTLGLGRIVVFGMSFGGMLALTYAAAYPQSIAGLIACATAASNEALDRALDGMHDLSSPEQREALARLRNGTVESPADLDRVFAALARFYEYDPAKTPPGGFKPIADIDMLNWFFARDRRTYDVRPRLANITAPTLVLTGRHDKIAPPFASDEIVKGIPHARQEIFEESGHRLMREENAKFLRTVRNFVGRL
jgi:proline iminopeptidase